MAKLDHPNIARAYDAESFGSLQAIVMEFVSGQTLGNLLKKRGRLPVRDACRCVRQACLGLQHAHEGGLVHRDLNPQNLMLAQDSGVIKILGFDLAKIVSEKKPAHGLTKTNMTMGTYEYSAPRAGDRRGQRRHSRRHLQPGLYALLFDCRRPAV